MFSSINEAHDFILSRLKEEEKLTPRLKELLDELKVLYRQIMNEMQQTGKEEFTPEEFKGYTDRIDAHMAKIYAATEAAGLKLRKNDG